MLPSSDGALYFGDKTKRYFELCNDSNYGIELDGILWMTVTHYYLAQKFHGNVHLQNTIAAFESPSQARQFVLTKTAVRDNIFKQMFPLALTVKWREFFGDFASLAILGRIWSNFGVKPFCSYHSGTIGHSSVNFYFLLQFSIFRF